jgi:hypothetical protein
VSATNGNAGDVDPAVRRARLVVGLYGDPGVTWSVLVRLRVVRPLDEVRISRAVQRVHATHGHLGPAPELERYPQEQRDAVLARFADLPYGDAGPLVRVALDRASTELVIAVHHGCADGLGLLGYASSITGVDLPTSARGVLPAAEPTSFVRGSLRRLGEAVVRPPVRISSAGRTGDRGDLLLTRDITPGKTSTPELVLAATRAVRAWNNRHGVREQPVVVALGLSRRPGTPTPPPDRDTAFARLATSALQSLADTRQLLAETEPEPAFPVTRGAGIGPLLTRALASRLGSTLLVSNLGMVGQVGVEGLEFWPVPSGPSGVCLGLASVPARTTVTVRLRRGWFTPDEANSFADLAVGELAAVRDG